MAKKGMAISGIYIKKTEFEMGMKKTKSFLIRKKIIFVKRTFNQILLVFLIIISSYKFK